MNERLGPDTLLQDVVDGARSPTGARHGGVTAVDDGGQPPVFTTSDRTPEERQLLLGLPRGLEVSAHLSILPQTLRVADPAGYTRKVDLPEIGPQWPIRALEAVER